MAVVHGSGAAVERDRVAGGVRGGGGSRRRIISAAVGWSRGGFSGDRAAECDARRWRRSRRRVAAFRGNTIIRGGNRFGNTRFYGGRYYSNFYLGFGYGGYPYYPYSYYPYSYDPYYYDSYYGAPYYDGGYYDNGYYGNNVVYAPPAPPAPPTVINQTIGAPSAGTAPGSFYRAADYYLIAFNDHTIRAALSYTVEGDQIRYTTREHEERTAPLSSVDVRFSEQINRDRRVEFRLP